MNLFKSNPDSVLGARVDPKFQTSRTFIALSNFKLGLKAVTFEFKNSGQTNPNNDKTI